MEPYFATHHIAGLILLVIVQAWGVMELSQISQERRSDGPVKVDGAAWRITMIACLLATFGFPYLATHLVPSAQLRPGAVWCAVGIVILLGGLVLRGWSFKVLGEYFTHTVMVSSDQPVIDSGPYRLLRHPSYTGILLASVGAGLASANWLALIGVTLLTLTPLLWRIRVEEHALLATVGDRYRSYTAQHKRMVPLVW
jgi:protein-S-isoprenylcysteine O-methyltransferase Ste14